MKRMFIPVLFLALFAGCDSEEIKTSIKEKKVIPVTTVEVKKEKLATDLKYSGTIEAYQTIPLSFETNGTVERVFVDAGDKVAKGQLLAMLDTTDSKNFYRLSLAKYLQAQDAYDRLKEVYEKGSLPEIKWVEMETNLEQAKSSLEISKSNLRKCKLYSPVNGLVGQRNIEPGMSSISVGSAPLEIVDIKKVYVKIAIPENEVNKIKEGMVADFTVSALDEASFEGTVTNISPVADKISRTYEAKIQVENADQLLKPGMVCDVTINKPSDKELVLVPYKSVTVDAYGNPFVYVVDTVKCVVNKQIIETSRYKGSRVEVLSGLSVGQFVVCEGVSKLSNNSEISL